MLLYYALLYADSFFKDQVHYKSSCSNHVLGVLQTVFVVYARLDVKLILCCFQLPLCRCYYCYYFFVARVDVALRLPFLYMDLGIFYSFFVTVLYHA